MYKMITNYLFETRLFGVEKNIVLNLDLGNLHIIFKGFTKKH